MSNKRRLTPAPRCARRMRLSAIARCARGTFALLCISLCLGACVAVGVAQTGAQQTVVPPFAQRAEGEAQDFVGRAIDAVCAERELDPRASVPIDVMQSRPNLSTRNADVLAGAARAARLLPVAKELAAESLSRLMSENGVSLPARRASLARIAVVERIKLDVPLRDNASIVYGDPRAIRFGTIFVASLRSDEGMVSVMAHELTHAADGARGSLAPLFRRVARRAEADAGLRQVSARRAEELTCDLVGVLAARLFVARHATDEPLARRAARAVEHNCVEHDETDAEHLSPRQTLRAVLALAPALASEVTGEAVEDAHAPLNHPLPSQTRGGAPASVRRADAATRQPVSMPLRNGAQNLQQRRDAQTPRRNATPQRSATTRRRPHTHL